MNWIVISVGLSVANMQPIVATQSRHEHVQPTVEKEDLVEKVVPVLERILGVEELGDSYSSAEDIYSAEDRQHYIEGLISEYGWVLPSEQMVTSGYLGYYDADEADQLIAGSLLVALLNAAGEIEMRDAVRPVSTEEAIAERTIVTEDGVMIRGGSLVTSRTDQEKMRQFHLVQKLETVLGVWLTESLTDMSDAEKASWLAKIGANPEASYLDLVRQLVTLPEEW